MNLTENAAWRIPNDPKKTWIETADRDYRITRTGPAAAPRYTAWYQARGRRDIIDVLDTCQEAMAACESHRRANP